MTARYVPGLSHLTLTSQQSGHCDIHFINKDREVQKGE